MKRFALMLMTAALLTTCFAGSASANSWGLRGELLSLVSSVNTWDDYYARKQSGDAAVMHSRYHNALMLAQDGALKVYTTAVYQPEDGRDDELALEAEDSRLTLSYGQSEHYVFGLTDEGYRLSYAMIGDFEITVYRTEWGTEWYEAHEGGESARWPRAIWLSEFNIELFPRSVDEVKHLNYMLAALDSGEPVFWGSEGEHTRRSNVGKGTAPVFSAPFEDSAWRAGNGKAAVGLKGEFWALSSYVREDGEKYACIRYDVSARTQRIGYVRAEDIGESYADDPTDDFIHVGVRANKETYLTDDPDVSQYPQFQVQEGTLLICMAIYDEYAYVSGEVRDGRFGDGGQIVWGFVPLRDLDIDPTREIQPDAMARLEGVWEFYAGGNQAQDRLIFYPDGTYQGITNLGDDDGEWVDTGAWTVTAYDPACNLYWNSPEYEITLVDDDGTVNVKGLSFGEDGGEETFSLTYWEGGGGYKRVTESGDGGNG